MPAPPARSLPTPLSNQLESVLPAPTTAMRATHWYSQVSFCSLNVLHFKSWQVELYTKRNFRCDCGPRLGQACKLLPSKEENVKNAYNQVEICSFLCGNQKYDMLQLFRTSLACTASAAVHTQIQRTPLKTAWSRSDCLSDQQPLNTLQRTFKTI